MKNTLKLMAIVAVAAMSLTSCNCFKKMSKKQDEVKVTCTPDVLTLNNGKIEADVTHTNTIFLPCRDFLIFYASGKKQIKFFNIQ